MTRTVLFGYEGSRTFIEPFPRFLAAASLAMWKKLGWSPVLYLDPEAAEGFRASGINEEGCTVKLLDVAFHRDLFNNRYFGIPKFLGMLQHESEAFISDLDVIPFNLDWFDAEKNWAQYNDIPELQMPLSEFHKIPVLKHIGLERTVNGGYYYLRTPELVRTVGQILMTLSTIAGQSVSDRDAWVYCDELLLPSILRDLGQEFEDLPNEGRIDLGHLHISRKYRGLESEKEWQWYMSEMVSLVKEKVGSSWTEIEKFTESLV